MAHADLRCTNCGDDLWCAMCGEPYQLPKGTRLIKVHGPVCTIDLKTEKPIPGRYLANDSDLVSYLKGRGVLLEIGDTT